MNQPRSEERIAQLLAQGDAQRLAAGLAIHEARQQLAPLRSAVGVVGMVARAVAPGGGVGSVLVAAAKFLIGHPALGPALAAVAWQGVRRRPIAVLLAAVAGAGAWWLLRPPSTAASQREQAR